jgi:2-oxoglutarate dehydrogenase E2 component (dihydrolipoamide succinyltransferase)
MIYQIGHGHTDYCLISEGGTFTITNHGVTGSLFATPIINQPQCAILGVGVIQKRPIVVTDPALGDVIAIRPMMYLSLTFDHRIIDGAIADYFLGKVVESLQNWT